MARRTRWEGAPDWDNLDTYEAVFQKSKNAPGKLIVILFNEQFSEPNTIEGRLKRWRKDYETKYGVQFYKCIADKGEQKIKTQFTIKDIPTFVFIRDGKEIDRIDKLDECDPNIADQTKSSEESKDETTLKKKLDELCKTGLVEKIENRNVETDK